MVEPKLLTQSTQPKEVSTAATLIPYARSDNRCKYLSWVCCGFSDEEALFVLGLPYAWLTLQREDEEFLHWESRVPELRKDLSQEYSEIDFYRNYRMVLEKDKRILLRSLGMDMIPDEDTGEMVAAEMTMFDQSYLLKLRSAYTPQQLGLLKSVASGGSDGFNFAEWVAKNQEVIQVSQTRTMTLKRGTDG